jgi:hypothetical protein
MEVAVVGSRGRDPFAPVEWVVSMMLWVLVLSAGAGVVVGVVEVVTGADTGASFVTVGDPEACATVRTGAVPYGGSGDADGSGVVGLRAGASDYPAEVRVCLADPTTFQKAASVLGPLGDLVLAVGSLWLVRRAVGAARRSGRLFTPVVAARTRALGWFLLAMSLLWPFLAAAGDGVVLAGAVRGVGWADQLLSPDLSPFAVVVALGILSFARILERAVPLQAEVDATV